MEILIKPIYKLTIVQKQFCYNSDIFIFLEKQYESRHFVFYMLNKCTND
jgi:hypothetical protein